MEYLTHLTSLNVFLIWLSLVSFGLFLYLAYKLRKVNKKLDSVSLDDSKKLQELETKALNESQAIIEAANKRAAEMTLKANEINSESSQKLQQTIDAMLESQKEALVNVSATVLKTHQEQVNELNRHILELAGNIYKDIDTNSRADIQSFFELIKKQTFEAEKYAEARIKEEYDKLEKEITLRREEKIKKLDENIYKILSNISKDIIGKSLDLSSQQDLIIKSLDQAKKDGRI